MHDRDDVVAGICPQRQPTRETAQGDGLRPRGRDPGSGDLADAHVVTAGAAERVLDVTGVVHGACPVTERPLQLGTRRKVAALCGQLAGEAVTADVDAGDRAHCGLWGRWKARRVWSADGH